ncbi:MAG: RNA polymerase alpha subunit C-terminal domain-containing protein [Imperialibacter sp.]|uniref:RNA polymerase alpha subunit C-terminal domain-containing protein n=1 Tax=Imperialibacter sp. TaxID=2038411 RepID=UPI0032EB7AF0
MTPPEKTLRTCKKGHQYYKSSDCPVCPICANEDKPDDDFLSTLVAPARRALQGKGITTVQELATHTEAEIMRLHGMGPSTLPKLQQALASAGLSFKP